MWGVRDVWEFWGKGGEYQELLEEYTLLLGRGRRGTGGEGGMGLRGWKSGGKDEDGDVK